ncbi:VWA domain-containing protein [Caldimonas brevitalea]|uniref:Tellurium resistance protein n=1 Tax=Caldimonas brevitalea TaxID=413882 RepID=A0A0G3BS12_9BURK|nr:VWA domain-containing protein [Caldimonas brevitalea]AKJ30191.1 tellurium resistance protein [Caldimonas brevitalea]
MSMINLVKKTEIVLAKRGITPVPSQVALAIDISGSMRDEYQAGIVQAVVERCLAVAMKFDSDQLLDVWVFDDGHGYVGQAKGDTIDHFVSREILKNKNIKKWGGTAYAPVLESIQAHYYGKEGKKAGMLGKLFGAKDKAGEAAKQAVGEMPLMILLITDGENMDRDLFESTLTNLRKRRAYVQFVGIGNSDLSYLEAVAEKEPNAGFVQLRQLRGIDDEQLLGALISPEFSKWIAKQA